MTNFAQRLLAILRSITGSFNWTPPIWYTQTAAKIATTPIGRANEKIKGWARANPKRAWIMSGAAAMVLIAAYAGYSYYQAKQAEIDFVEVKISAPSPTHPKQKVINPLRITFSESAAKPQDLNKVVTSGVKITPKIQGTWKWENDTALSFQPSGADSFDWPAGREYEVQFDRGFFPSQLNFQTRTYKFSTDALTFNFYKSEFYIDPNQPSLKRVVATVASNYPFNPESLKKNIRFLYQSADDAVLKKPAREIKSTVSFNSFFTEAYLESENLAVPGSDQEMVVQVGKGITPMRDGAATEGEISRKVRVPGIHSALAITNLEVQFIRNEKFEPEQALFVSTGIPVKSEDVEKYLEVFLLPAHHRPAGSKKVQRNYEWSSPEEFSADVKKASETLKLQVNPTENAYSTLHSFRIQAPVLRSLYVHVKKKLSGLGGYELKNDHEQMISIPDFKPELEFMTGGAILSVSGDQKLPLLARNVENVEFEISRVIPAQTNHLIQTMSSSFKSPYFYDDAKNFTSEKFTTEQKLNFKSRSDTVYFSLDLGPYLKDSRGFFFITARSKSKADDSGNQRQSVAASRLVLVTDLGIIAKQNASGSTELFVQDMRSGSPVSDATVEVLGMNGISALSLKTGTTGSVSIPELKDFKNERQPIAYVVRRGQDTSYLPKQAWDRNLSFSRFNVGGDHESSDSDRLTAMLFSDRGIYRPGESVNLGLILRSKTVVPNQGELPLLWTVSDPRGMVIHTERITSRAFDLKDLGFSTKETSPTGTYNVRVSVIRKEKQGEVFDQLGDLSVSVEEFVPDQMKIHSAFTPYTTLGWVPTGPITAQITLKNLFGSAAQNRQITARYTLIPVSPYAAAFKDYTFRNPNKPDARTISESLPDVTSDDKGEAKFDLDLSQYDGYFQLRLESEGFQAEGGRGVRAVSTVNMSSFPVLVGYKADGDLQFIHRDAKRTVKWIALNSSQKQVAAKNIQLALTQIKFVSALMRQDDGTYKYQSVRKETDLKEEKFAVDDGGTTLTLPTATAGTYAYILRDEKGRDLNRLEFNVVGDANLARSLDRTAELEIVLNKADYMPGEEIELQIRAPYIGSGLITIERDKVYSHKWFKASNTSSVERIKIPEGLQGNAYVNVTYLRSMQSKDIFMSPLSYGVQPFSINLDQHRTRVKLDVPDKVKPGQKLTVTYSSDRPTKLVLYGVDEGILQVAKYKLPNPLEFFFRKKALQVSTSQLLDLLLPDYSVVKELSASGGDAGDEALGQNLNPFKRKGQPPVVFWSKILSADSTEKKFTWQTPEFFNGNIKVMAVASSERGLGSTEVGVISRGDFVITPSTPLFVAPGDEFTVSVSVSNQIEGAKGNEKVTVSLDTSPYFEIQGGGSPIQTADIPQGSEKSVDYRLKARGKLGSGELVFKSHSGKYEARMPSAISVRPVMPFETTLEMGLAEKGGQDIKLGRSMLPEYRKKMFDLSPLPVSIGKGLAGFLEDFPYGCTEQVISKAVPGLLLKRLPEVGFDPKKMDEFHRNVVSVLRERQTPDGGFGLYSGRQSAFVPATLHAIHYLTEAESRGISVPSDMMQRSMNFLRSSDRRQVGTLSEVRLFAQSLYLQSKNRIVPSNDLLFLQEVLEREFKGKWEKDETAIYLAGTYALLKQEEKGVRLIQKLAFGDAVPTDYATFRDPLARDALLLEIVASHYPGQLPRLAAIASMEKLIGPLKKGSYNTYSSSQVLMAFDSMLGAAERNQTFKDFSISQILPDGKSSAVEFSKGIIAKSNLFGEATAVKLSNSSTVPLYYSATEKGYDRELPKKEIKEGLEIDRQYLSASGSPVTKVKLGEEVTVSLKVRAVDESIEHMVLVDLFPAGFDFVLDSRLDSASEETHPATEGDEGEENGDGGGGEGEGDGEASFFLKDLIRSSYAENAAASSLEPFKTSFADYREDRVVVYGWAEAKKLTEFRYRLKAVNRGKFTMPPVFGESLYNRAVRYRGMAGTIEVE